MPGRGKSKRGKRRRRTGRSNSALSLLKPGPQVPGSLVSSTVLNANRSISRVQTFDLPGSSLIVTTAAGALASTTTISVSDIIDFSNFANIYQEFRIIGATLEFKVINVNAAAGVIAAYINEVVSAVPTATTSQSARRLEINCVVPTNAGSRKQMIKWKAHQFETMDFDSTGVVSTLFYLKMFQDVANYGGAGATTVKVGLTFRVQFRGLD